jgi:hypothetical protein
MYVDRQRESLKRATGHDVGWCFVNLLYHQLCFLVFLFRACNGTILRKEKSHSYVPNVQYSHDVSFPLDDPLGA